MELHNIPPVARSQPSFEGNSVKGEIIPILKTGQAAGPVFTKGPTVSEEKQFSRTASLSDDLAPLKARVKNLWENKDYIAPDDMQKEIKMCKKGLQGLHKQLENLEFANEFPLMGELDIRQEGSFAANLLSDAKKTLAGG